MFVDLRQRGEKVILFLELLSLRLRDGVDSNGGSQFFFTRQRVLR